MIIINTKTAQQSITTLQELMHPEKANVNGDIHGGELYKMMDDTAGVVAYKHSKAKIVTAKADKVVYSHPVRIGKLVSSTGRITFVGKSSMEVWVRVYVENPREGEERKLAVSGYFTMVALDKENKPTAVPSLELIDDEDYKLFKEGQKRYLDSQKEKL